MAHPTQTSERSSDPQRNVSTLPDSDSDELPSPSQQGRSAPKQIGRYKIEKLLGTGAMGEVYLAQDQQLNRSVALKIPNFDKGEPSNPAKRFMREAQSAATLTHPNICPIYEFGEEDGRHFITMGYIDGRPLCDYISSGKKFPERQIAVIVRKVALALQEAHDHGIIHRDLKPANIMINQRNEPVVMDFGLAQQIDDETVSRLTKEGMVVGTPAYMSPEQVKGNRKLGPQTDVYSLGVVLYEFLAGKIPFSGNFVSVISQVLHAKAKPIEELRPDISPALAEICRKAMEKKPEERFESMKAFASALGKFIKGKPLGKEVRAGQLPEVPISSATFDDDEDDEFPNSGGPLPTIAASAAKTQSREITVSMTPMTLIIGAAVLLLMAFGTAMFLLSTGGGNSTQDNGETLAVVDSNQAKQSSNKTTSTSSAVNSTSQSGSADSSERTARNRKKKVPGLTILNKPQKTNRKTEESTTEPADSKVVAAVDSKPPLTPGPQTNLPESPLGPGNSSEPAGENFQRPPPRPPQLGRDANEIMKNNDFNQDGFLDAGEMPIHIIFNIDSNKDQKLTLKELSEAMRTKRLDQIFGPPTFDAIFAGFDRNGDKSIGEKELDKELIDPADKNRDGKASKAELLQEFKEKGMRAFGLPEGPGAGERPPRPFGPGRQGGDRKSFGPPGGNKPLEGNDGKKKRRPQN